MVQPDSWADDFGGEPMNRILCSIVTIAAMRSRTNGAPNSTQTRHGAVNRYSFSSKHLKSVKLMIDLRIGEFSPISEEHGEGRDSARRGGRTPSKDDRNPLRAPSGPERQRDIAMRSEQ